MESVEGQVEHIEDDSQVLEEIPVQLEEGYDEETLALVSPPQLNLSSRSKYYKQTYRPAWEQMPDFRGWLRGVVGEPTRAYCTYCQKTLHAHRLSLLKHTCTIRHQKAAQIHNARKNKSHSNLGVQDVHTVVLQQEDVNQSDPEGEEAKSLAYAEHSEEDDEEDEEAMHKEIMEAEMAADEEEDEQESAEVNQVPFTKLNPNFQGNVTKTPISTSVVDGTKGCPIAGLQVSLYKLIDGRWTYINEGLTNVNGKFSNFVDRNDFSLGRYKLHFDVDRYFEAKKQDSMYPFIEIVFDCRVLTDNYHISLLVSPYTYSTFRGS